jgi:hypothetical protein
MINDSIGVAQDKSKPRHPLTDKAPQEQPPSVVSPSGLSLSCPWSTSRTLSLRGT